MPGFTSIVAAPEGIVVEFSNRKTAEWVRFMLIKAIVRPPKLCAGSVNWYISPQPAQPMQ